QVLPGPPKYQLSQDQPHHLLCVTSTNSSQSGNPKAAN
ncbi:uncharacterized protein METZ01_LOCUS272180, partial [marine metagenome]